MPRVLTFAVHARPAFVLLRLGFTAAPIAFGLDKFWNQMSTGRSTWPLDPSSDAGDGAAVVRDFGLLLGALTLARLASVYDPPIRLRR